MKNENLNKFAEILRRAKLEKFAIGAFNFSTLEQLRAIFEAAWEKRSPIILQTSQSEAKFIGIQTAPGLVRLFQEKYKLPAIINLDHGKEITIIKKAIEAGYDMVHFDGSGLELEENLTKTKEVLDYAHSHGVLVEGELGYLRGSSRIQEETSFMSKEDYTKPEEAKQFVEKTGVDFLAISVGNMHGILKNNPTNPPLDIERIRAINDINNNAVFLTLHGGSGTDQSDIKHAVEAGITKININTELRLAYTKNLRISLDANKEEITPYKYLKNSITETKKVVEDKISLFGSMGVSN